MNGNFTAPQCAQSQSRWRTPPRGSRRGRKRPEGGERDCKRDARRNWLWLRLRRWEEEHRSAALLCAGDSPATGGSGGDPDLAA
mmetsp:Transcript_2473/g.6051  ORF Transcript_2473/g.6051 Transcript_2473/m.6051 type:complete len:84 (+) Transcript_2473:42-293(+)